MQPTSINNWLQRAISELDAVGIESARLDTLLLLSDELEHDKTWVLAHAEQNLDTSQQIRLSEKMSQRLKRMPMAYIRGVQEFYGRNFNVTNNVLVPRPESETIVELLHELPRRPNDSLIDIGTGSGALAISAKLSMQDLKVFASDISQPALDVAIKNAERLSARITFIKSNLLTSVGTHLFNFIVANLPYVDKQWETSPEIKYEPEIALFAADEGLELIKKLITQSIDYLAPKGYVLLEADPRQHPRILQFADSFGLKLHKKEDFILVLTTK